MELVALGVAGGAVALGTAAMLPVFKIVARVAPYAYPNARIRAMRPLLIRPEEFENLSGRPYTDVVYVLEQRIPHLAKIAGADYAFSSLDTALRSELIETLLKVRRISPESTKAYIGVLLSKYDIQVIESIVRSQSAKINVKYDILHATEVFSKAFITRRRITIEDLQNELKGTVYQEIMDKHIEQIKAGEYREFEEALNHLYFRRLLHQGRTSPTKGYTKRLIDSHNVSLALKGLEPTITGGRVPQEELRGRELQQIVSALNANGYSLQADEPAQLERALQISLTRYGEGLMARDPLSEASIIGYVVLKTANTRNTAILLKLKQHDVEPSRIQEVLAL